MEKKKGLIQKLVVGSRQNETGYIMRALQGKLRIGLAEQTVLVALAQAVLLHRQALHKLSYLLPTQVSPPQQRLYIPPGMSMHVPSVLAHHCSFGKSESCTGRSIQGPSLNLKARYADVDVAASMSPTTHLCDWLWRAVQAWRQGQRWQACWAAGGGSTDCEVCVQPVSFL